MPPHFPGKSGLNALESALGSIHGMVDALRSYSCVLIGSEDDALEGEEGQAGEGEGGGDGEEGEKKRDSPAGVPTLGETGRSPPSKHRASVPAFANSHFPKNVNPLSLESKIGVPPTPGRNKGAAEAESNMGGEAEAEAIDKVAVAKARPPPPGRDILIRWCAQTDPEASHVDGEELSDQLKRSLKKLSVHREIDADEAEEEFYARLRVIQVPLTMPNPHPYPNPNQPSS